MLEAAIFHGVESDRVRASGEGSRYDAAVRALVESTLRALRSRRPRRYASRREESSSLKGRIDPFRSELLMMRRPGKIVTEWIELDDNVPELRFIKAVLEFTRSRVEIPTRRWIDLLMVELDRVPISSNPRVELASTNRQRLGRQWASAVLIAEDIMNERVGGLFAGSAVSDAEILYLPTLFQTYVAQGLQRWLRSRGFGSAQQQRHKMGRWSSGPFKDQEAIDVYTDFEIQRRGVEQVGTIVDTKWKELRPASKTLGVASDDVQQLIAYGYRLECPDLALVYPWLGERSPFEVAPTLRVGAAHEPFQIHVHTLPLLAPDLSTAVANLAEDIFVSGTTDDLEHVADS